MNSFYKNLSKFVSSKLFFSIILLIFLVSAVWIAISARYPMAFDEDYHLGLIRLHALQWNPIFTEQPTGVAQFGALTRDPSYLFHYLMSFPYRLLTALNVSQTTLVVVLRLINILLFSISLVAMRKLLLKTKASVGIIHICLLFFVLTPVVPLLAATINYDNLQILLVAVALLLTIRFKESLSSKKIDIKSLAWVLVVSMLACLVKFTFLPILTAIVVYIVYLLFKFMFQHRGKLYPALSRAWRTQSRYSKLVLAIPFLISLGLFVNTYGVNLIRYHIPVPQCGQVLDVQRCSAYPPWNRNHNFALHNTGVDPNPLPFMVSWIAGMFDRLFFTINGHGRVADNTNYLAPIMSATAILIALFGIALVIRYGRQLIRRDSVLGFLLFTTFVYCASLWGRNYNDYLHLGKIVAINGRYLIPIILPVYLLVAQGYQRFLVGRQTLKALILSTAFLLFLQGGGAISFIYYSNSNWYWPRNQFVNHLNNNAKRIINPLFLSGDFPYNIK